MMSLQITQEMGTMNLLKVEGTVINPSQGYVM